MDNKTETKVGIFGLYDGLTSALGLVVAAALCGGQQTVVMVAVALAAGASLSMASGEWLSDGGNFKSAILMGLTTLVGSSLPALPWIFTSGTLAFILCGVTTFSLALLISWLRPGNWKKSILTTFGVLLIASSIAVIASCSAGGMG